MFPPNIDDIRAIFPIKNRKGIIFTYAPFIYNPDHGTIDHPLMVHEETHISQQGTDPASWWQRYLTDSEFRLQQELEAYRNQYWAMKDSYKDRNYLATRLHNICLDLSSSMYGSIINYEDARKYIMQR